MSANLPRNLSHTLYFIASTGHATAVVIFEIKTYIERPHLAHGVIEAVIDRWVRTTEDGYKAYQKGKVSILRLASSNSFTLPSLTSMLVESGIEIVSTKVALPDDSYGDATRSLVKDYPRVAVSTDVYRVWSKGDRLRAEIWDGPTTNRRDGLYFDKGDCGTVIATDYVSGELNLQVRWDRQRRGDDGVSWIYASKATYLPAAAAA